jgi:hypothetical protein
MTRTPYGYHHHLDKTSTRNRLTCSLEGVWGRTFCDRYRRIGMGFSNSRNTLEKPRLEIFVRVGGFFDMKVSALCNGSNDVAEAFVDGKSMD